jgi:hypothetical protein
MSRHLAPYVYRLLADRGVEGKRNEEPPEQVVRERGAGTEIGCSQLANLKTSHCLNAGRYGAVGVGLASPASYMPPRVV